MPRSLYINFLHPLKFCVLYSLSGILFACSELNSKPSIAPSPLVQASPSPQVTPSPQKSQAIQKLELNLKHQIQKKAAIPVQTITCPEQTPLSAQKPFTCQAVAAGKSFAVSITPQSKKNNQSPELQWNTENLLVLPKVEQIIRQDIQKQFSLNVKADCGGTVKVAKPGDTFQCKVTDDRGQTKVIPVQVDDEKGNITWKL